MSFLVRLTDAEAEIVATEVLAREMKDMPFERALVRSGEDHAGVQSLFVAAVVGPGVPTLDGRVSARLHGAVHEALLSRGEERFPYFVVRRTDDEPAPDVDTVDQA